MTNPIKHLINSQDEEILKKPIYDLTQVAQNPCFQKRLRELASKINRLKQNKKKELMNFIGQEKLTFFLRVHEEEVNKKLGDVLKNLNGQHYRVSHRQKVQTQQSSVPNSVLLNQEHEKKSWWDSVKELIKNSWRDCVAFSKKFIQNDLLNYLTYALVTLATVLHFFAVRREGARLLFQYTNVSPWAVWTASFATACLVALMTWKLGQGLRKWFGLGATQKERIDKQKVNQMSTSSLASEPLQSNSIIRVPGDVVGFDRDMKKVSVQCSLGTRLDKYSISYQGPQNETNQFSKFIDRTYAKYYPNNRAKTSIDKIHQLPVYIEVNMDTHDYTLSLRRPNIT